MSKTTATVAYVTDVEGQWDRLASFARENPCVALSPEGKLTVAEDCVFVFGGDAIDRGPHGRRVVATLLEAKQRQPSQVVLIAGNRDVNKLRLPRELQGFPPSKTPSEVREGSRAGLLRWIFEYTMGARGALEFHIEELSREHNETVSDEDAVANYVASLEKDGLLRAYLSSCQLAYQHGSTLFVHGGIGTEALGVVPGVGRFEELGEWIARLNDWYRSQMELYCNDPAVRAGDPPYLPLVLYQAPLRGHRINPQSVIYNRHSDELNNPFLPPEPVMNALKKQSVHRLVVGHTPSGDAPGVLVGSEFELVVADNSRGRVSTGSRVFVQGDAARIEASAKLDDGREVQLQFALPAQNAPQVLGRRVANTGQLVSGRTREGALFLFRYLPGYVLEQQLSEAVQLQDKELIEPGETSVGP